MATISPKSSLSTSSCMACSTSRAPLFLICSTSCRASCSSATFTSCPLVASGSASLMTAPPPLLGLARRQASTSARHAPLRRPPRRWRHASAEPLHPSSGGSPCSAARGPTRGGRHVLVPAGSDQPTALTVASSHFYSCGQRSAQNGRLVAWTAIWSDLYRHPHPGLRVRHVSTNEPRVAGVSPARHPTPKTRGPHVVTWSP